MSFVTKRFGFVMVEIVAGLAVTYNVFKAKKKVSRENLASAAAIATYWKVIYETGIYGGLGSSHTHCFIAITN